MTGAAGRHVAEWSAPANRRLRDIDDEPDRRAERTGPEELYRIARAVRHEFNNLLTIIRSNLEPLRQAPADERTRKRLDRIALGVDRAIELVYSFIAKVQGSALSAAPAPPPPTLPRAQEGETILLVEPDPLLRDQTVAMLRSLGYGVDQAADADEAVRRLAAGSRSDLLLTDGRVRCRNGLTLADAARGSRPDVAVLQTTVSSDAESGALVKPFQLLALAKAVRDAIDAAKPAPS